MGEVGKCPFAGALILQLFLIVVQFQIHVLENVPNGQVGIGQIAAVLQLLEIFHDDVFFVPDFAHQFLQCVLGGGDAVGTAEVVQHDGNGHLLGVHFTKQIVHGSGVMHKQRCIDQTAQVGVLVLAVGLEILAHLQGTDDVVCGALVHRVTAVAVAQQIFHNLFGGGGNLQRIHIHTGGQNAVHGNVAEFQSGADELTLLFIEGAFVGHILNNIVQLIFGDGHFLFPAHMTCGKLTDLGQHKAHRGEQAHKHQQAGSAHQRQAFAISLGNALGQHFPKEENCQSGDDCTHCNKRQAELTGHDNGDHGSHSQVRDVGADEHGGHCLVEVFQYQQRLIRAAVSAFLCGTNLDFVHRCKRCFRYGKVGHKQIQYKNNDP